MRHVLILSYFSAPEIERYKLLATVLARWPKPAGFDVSCLLCSVSTGVEADTELESMMARVMPTTSYRCSTTVVGYPQRPSAMFWEIHEQVAAANNGDGGFALWMEADMVPTRPTWLADLDREWRSHPNPLVMGMLMRRVYFPNLRIYTDVHINGGACYAKDYARQIPSSARWGAFDTVPWRHVEQTGRGFATNLFELSTLNGLDDQLRTSPAAVLHGYRQDKPAFYRRWFARVSGEQTDPLRGSAEVCCDLRARHLLLDYCPLHSEFTPRVRATNAVSLLANVPYLAMKRRWRMLRERRKA